MNHLTLLAAGFLGLLVVPKPALSTTLFAANFSGRPEPSLWTLDIATGEASLVGPLTTGGAPLSGISGLEWDDATETMYASRATQQEVPGQLYTVDFTTGVCTPIGPLGFNSIEGGLAFDESGTLYALYDITDPPDPMFWTIDTATGAGTAVGPLGVLFDFSGIAFSPKGTLYGWTESSPDRLYTIDPATGAATLVGTMTPDSFRILGGLDFHPDTGTLYWNDGVSLRNLDTDTAETTLVGDTGGSISMSAIVFTSVPEPAAALQLLVGATVLASLRRRRARCHQPR